MIAYPVAERQGVRAAGWFLDGRGDLSAVELLRMALGPIVLLHLQPFLARSLDGLVYSDRFYQPYVGWYPEAPEPVYTVLLWLAAAAAVALGIGAATRVAAGYTAGFVAYNLFLSTTHFGNNRAFLLVLLIGATLLPLGSRWSVDAWVRHSRGQPPRPEGPLWPLLLRFEVVMVFFASGFSKLIDPDWWGGTVLWLRFVDGRAAAADSGVPDWLLDLVTTQEFHTGFAKLAVLTELGIAPACCSGGRASPRSGSRSCSTSPSRSGSRRRCSRMRRWRRW